MFHVDILFYSQQVLKFNTMKLKFIADTHMIDLSVIQITCFAFSMLFTYIMAYDHVKRQNSMFCVKKRKKKRKTKLKTPLQTIILFRTVVHNLKLNLTYVIWKTLSVIVQLSRKFVWQLIFHLRGVVCWIEPRYLKKCSSQGY